MRIYDGINTSSINFYDLKQIIFRLRYVLVSTSVNINIESTAYPYVNWNIIKPSSLHFAHRKTYGLEFLSTENIEADSCLCVNAFNRNLSLACEIVYAFDCLHYQKLHSTRRHLMP